MAQHIKLKKEERTELSQLIKSGKHPARVLGRARILLLLDRSQGQKRKLHEVADAMLTSMGTVSNVKRRFLKGGLEHGLHDRPRPGAKPKIDGEVEARRIAEKIEWHYTPVHASWLNIAECELSVLRRQCLRSRLPDIATVSEKVAAWTLNRNSKQIGIDWRFTTDDARIKLKRLYPVVNVQNSA